VVELRLDRPVPESVVHIQQDWHFEQERRVEGMSALLDSDILVVDGMWALHTAHSLVHTTGHDILGLLPKFCCGACKFRCAMFLASAPRRSWKLIAFEWSVEFQVAEYIERIKS
jgi:hypothetical protein